MANWLFGSFREWALMARRRKESKSLSLIVVLGLQVCGQVTAAPGRGRSGSAAEITKGQEPTVVEFVTEQRPAALSLAGSQTVDRAPVATGELP